MLGCAVLQAAHPDTVGAGSAAVFRAQRHAHAGDEGVIVGIGIIDRAAGQGFG